jgi:WS/DGAT/MGAT family acyltransferase
MATQPEIETFSSVDAAWLHMDTPTNLAVITGVISFDTPVDFERLKATLENRLLIHRRFHQRIQESPRGLGLPRWETDPNFELDTHLVRITLPEPGDHAALQDLVGEMMGTPLDLSRPLWQFYYVDNYQEGSALICRLHHCIADGIALMQLLLSTADIQPDAPWPEPPEVYTPEELGLFTQLLIPAVRAAKTAGKAWRTTRSFVHEGVQTLTHPIRLLDVARSGADVTLALGKLLLIPPDRRTVLRGKCGTSKRTAWSKAISLDEVKAIGRLMGGTINDVLLSAVTGALRRYLEERGEFVEGLDIRAIVPVNLRPPEELELMGNRFGLVFLSLPLGVRDPLKRLVVLRRRMDDIKRSPEAIVALNILGAIGLTPIQIENIIVTIFGLKGTAVMTNVPGPRQSLYMAGARIDNMMFWVPTPGNLGLGVSIISYAGDVVLGVATDEGLIPDPEMILQNFYDELEQMKRWGRPSAKMPRQTRVAGASRYAAPGIQASSSEMPAAQPGEAVPGQCQALTKTGKRCKNRALAGQSTCQVHHPKAT